ncbi:MAG TPA: hypothetical protein VMP01_04570 [Pirellulaceae bacterium]|nr:hypothetical protein [Pirellulaceae bacterium]
MYRAASNPRFPLAASRTPSSLASFPSVPFLPFLLLAFLLLIGSGAFGQAQPSADARFLAGLRQRRLFELAEKYARDKLAEQTIKPVEQADLSIELIRTLAQHAAFARPEERDALWKAARTTAADFLRTDEKHPRLILVRVQDALTPLLQGELARQELEAGGAPAGGVDGAKALVREATRLLEALSSELDREIPIRRRATLKEGELTGDELFSLQHHVQHQLARAQRNQGLLYEPKSVDRTSSLQQARETLQQALRQSTDDPKLIAQLRLDLAICQRLLGEHEGCQQLLKELEPPEIPTAVRLTARAELIRLAIDRQQLAAAQKLVEEGRLIDGQASAELDLATLEMCLAQLQSASLTNDKPAIEKWQKLAAQQARLLTEQHGSYWGRRADQLLVRSLPQGSIGNAELLMRTADSLYLKGEFDQAIAAYDQAADKASRAGDDKAALELSYKAALVQEERKLHQDAADRFCARAVQLKAQPAAAAAHLRGVWNAAQEVRRDASYQRQYEKLLVELIDTWPASEPAQQARLWQGRLHESRQEWGRAAASYTSVPAESEHFSAAVAAAIPVLRKELAALAAGGKDVQDEARRALAYLRGVVLGPQMRLPDMWNDSQRAAALAAAEIVFDYLPGDAAAAEELLKSGIESAGDAPAEWKTAAQAQLVLALASQPAKRRTAELMLQEMSEASPAQLLDLLEGLSAVVRRSRPDVRREMAALELATVELLLPQRQKLDGTQQLSLDRVHAEALAAANRRDEAISLFAALAKKNPLHGDIQEAYGDLLLAGQDKDSLAKGLAQWRIVAARSKPRSERWLKARYSVALAQSKLGEKKQAAALLEYLLLTPPGLDGTPWKVRCEALLEECRR